MLHVEQTSKHNKFGLDHGGMEPKCVKILSNDKNPERCVVRIYKEYVAHR